MGNSQGDLVQELAGKLAEKPWGELSEAFQEGMEEAQEKIGGTLGEEFGEEPVCMFILFQFSSVLLGSLLFSSVPFSFF